MERQVYKNLTIHDGELPTTTTTIIITPLKCPICGEVRPSITHYDRRHKVSLEVKKINW